MSICLSCGSTESVVTDSRKYEPHHVIRRRRRCSGCGRRYSTLELPVDHHPRVQEMCEWLIEETERIYAEDDSLKIRL